MAFVSFLSFPSGDNFPKSDVEVMFRKLANVDLVEFVRYALGASSLVASEAGAVSEASDQIVPDPGRGADTGSILKGLCPTHHTLSIKDKYVN